MKFTTNVRGWSQWSYIIALQLVKMEERVYDLKEGVTPTHSKIDNGIKVSIKRASHIVEEVVVSLLSSSP